MNATTLRRRAAEIGDDIAQMVATAVQIGEADGWAGERYAAIARDIEKYKATRAALLARAVTPETPAA